MKLKPLILLGSVFAMSTAVVIIKMVKVDPATLAAYRQFLAALVLAPLFLRGLKDFKFYLKGGLPKRGSWKIYFRKSKGG